MLTNLRLELEYFFERNYYKYWGCKRGKHYMKLSGCVYCGKDSGSQVKIWL